MLQLNNEIMHKLVFFNIELEEKTNEYVGVPNYLLEDFYREVRELDPLNKRFVFDYLKQAENKDIKNNGIVEKSKMDKINYLKDPVLTRFEIFDFNELNKIAMGISEKRNYDDENFIELAV